MAGALIRLYPFRTLLGKVGRSAANLISGRFLLRHPYGKKTDPIDRFDREEFMPQEGLSGILWGNAAILADLLVRQTAHQQGLAKMDLGSEFAALLADL